MTIEHQLLALIAQGESLTLEFKTCAKRLNRDVYETVCAFLNRHGGTLLLGVTDSGDLTGVDPDCVAQIKKDFITAINNPQKLSPPSYLSMEDIALNGKTVLRIYVPESSQVHRCNGRIYDRNEDGDLDITDHTRSVAELYHRKQANYSENKIYPYATSSDLREDLIAWARKVAGIQRKNHPWLSLSDLEFLKSAQLYQTDYETGQSGVTLAGILLLGKDDLILSVIPHHRTDLLLRRINLDRYDDRDFVTTNLIETFDRIMAFTAKHLPDPFYLEGSQRISIRDAIFREVASNILIHREYLNPFPAKLIIERGQVRTENSNNPHGFGPIDPDTFSPFPKNPVIARFFREIGRADELGSGVRNLLKYSKAYGGKAPALVEADIFRIAIAVPESGLSTVLSNAGQVTGQVTGQVDAWILNVLMACQIPKKSSEIQDISGIKHRETFQRNYLDYLLKEDLLARTIPEKPKSPMQRYQTTAKGQQLLQGI